MPVEEYSLAHLRDAVAMVLQKNTLFSGSLRENLLWGNPEAPDEKLLRACRMPGWANFWTGWETALIRRWVRAEATSPADRSRESVLPGLRFPGLRC